MLRGDICRPKTTPNIMTIILILLFSIPLVLLVISARKPELDSDHLWSERELQAGWGYRFLVAIFWRFSWIVGLLLVFGTVGSFSRSELGGSGYWLAGTVVFFLLVLYVRLLVLPDLLDRSVQEHSDDAD